MIDKKTIISDANKSIEKKSFVWNMVASLMYSAQSPLLLLVITRIIGLYEAGIFSVTYSLAHMFTNVGLYNMRSYQVSDTIEEYKFSDYYSSRIVTTIIMIISCTAYSIFGKYDLEKMQLVLLWVLYRSIESVEDVYHGEVQKQGRLDIVSKIVFIRISISLLLFLIIIFISKKLIWATGSLVMSAMIVYIVSNFYLKKKYNLKAQRQYKQTRNLLYTCFPVFISSFLYSYFVNAPKYAIDYYLSPESQSIFTIIFLPNMVINMIGIFIFKPMIGKMGEMWNKNEIKQFEILILKQSIFLVAGTMVLVFAGTLIGLPLLALIYGVSLEEYKIIFALLLFFGGISALNNYYSIVITVMRKQKYLMLAYGMGIFLCLSITNYAVKSYELSGAAWSFGIVMLPMFVIMALTIRMGIRRKKKDI